MYKLRLTDRDIKREIESFKNWIKGLKTSEGTYEVGAESKDGDAVIIIFKEAYEKIMALVNECDKEIAWHCTIERTENNTFTIKDVLVFPQTVTGCTVTSDDTEYANWVMSLSDEQFNSMRCHCHSHVNMGVHPSGVDTQYQQDMLANLQDYYIFMIFNKRGNIYSIIYDVQNNIVFEDDDIVVFTPDEETRSWARTQMDTYVTDITARTTYKPTTCPDNITGQMDIDEDGFEYNYGWTEEYKAWQEALDAMRGGICE